MAQNDMEIANQGFPAFRADLNSALAALVSNSSGATAPSATFAHQFWVDTSANPSVLKQRNANDDAWVTIGSIDQTTDTFNLAIAQGGTGSDTVATAKVALEVISGLTGSTIIPAGTEAQRDGSPAAGFFRFNIDVAKFEGYNGTGWNAFDSSDSPTFTGAIYENGSVRGNVVAVAALDIDCSLGNYFTKTIAANSTFTFSNVPASVSFAFTLELTHTSGAVTWPTEVKFPGDTAPTITDGNTSLFIFVTDDGGTRWRGAALVDYVN